MAIKSLLERIARFLYFQRVLVYKISLGEYDRSFQVEIDDITLDMASLEDVNTLRHNPGMDLQGFPLNVLKDKIQSGVWKCVVAKQGNDIVGYGFYSTREMTFAGSKTITFKLPNKSGYIFKLFVSQSHRNLKLGKVLADYRIRKLKHDGVETIYSAVNSDNHIQTHNMTNIGAVIIGSVFFFKTEYFNNIFISNKVRKILHRE